MTNINTNCSTTGFMPTTKPPGVLNYVGGCYDYGECGECEGDCDYDYNCEGDLRCAQRSTGDSTNVPGCQWGAGYEDIKTSNIDFCKFFLHGNDFSN